MDRILEQSLLFDFYGELLTEHQRRIYEEVVMDDCSLGEVAEEHGISRQGVHDIVKRCGRTMQDYEQKLKLVEKYRAVWKQVGEVEEIVEASGLDRKEELIEKLHGILDIM